MSGPQAVQASAVQITPPLRVAAAGAVQALPRSPFLAGRHGPLRLKPRFSSLADLARVGRGGKGGLHRKRKKSGASDPAAGAHEAQERELLLKDLRGALDLQAQPGDPPARQSERDAAAFSWLELLLGTRHLGARALASQRQPADTPGRSLKGFDPRLGQQVVPAAAPGANPRAWEAGIYRHLLKAGIVSAPTGPRSILFGHAPRTDMDAQTPARLLRRPPEEAAVASPLSGRLRGLLGGVGRWRAGLRRLLRSVESLLNGARAVLGCWFEAGRFRAAGIAAGSHAGVRGWVFP